MFALLRCCEWVEPLIIPRTTIYWVFPRTPGVLHEAPLPHARGLARRARLDRNAAARRRKREDRLRGNQQNQGAGASTSELESHGDLELADGCVRPASDRCAQHAESGRVGRRKDEGVGCPERRTRKMDVAARLHVRMDERQVLYGG